MEREPYLTSVVVAAAPETVFDDFTVPEQMFTEGTLVSIVHSGLPQPDAKPYAAGWTHYLGQLAAAGGAGDAGPGPFAPQART